MSYRIGSTGLVPSRPKRGFPETRGQQVLSHRASPSKPPQGGFVVSGLRVVIYEAQTISALLQSPSNSRPTLGRLRHMLMP